VTYFLVYLERRDDKWTILLQSEIKNGKNLERVISTNGTYSRTVEEQRKRWLELNNKISRMNREAINRKGD
jgi:hypothetical protein